MHLGYEPGTGKRLRAQGTALTQREASELAVAAAAGKNAGAHVAQGRDRSVGEWLDEWLETYVRPNREPRTVAYYALMIERHLKPLLGTTGLRKLEGEAVQALLNEKSKTLSPETVRGIRSTLRAALGQAFRGELVGRNVAQLTSAPKRVHRAPRALSAEQAMALYAALDGTPIAGLVRLTLHTGLRLGEATGLTWESVDFQAKTLRVTQQLQRIDGRLQLKGLKTERARRALHLTGSALDVLRAERARQGVELEAGSNALGLVFLNSEGRPFDPRNVDEHLKKAMLEAGLPRGSFHQLRHTAATLALASGVPLVAVRDQLGHSQISLTADIYGHAVPTALRDAAEALERAYRGGS